MAKKEETKQAEGIEVKDIKEAQEKIAELQKDGSLNKPTEEEVNEATKIFNEQAKEFNETKFEIGTPEEFDKVYDFVMEFMDKHVYWTKQGWMGVLRMVEELEQLKKDRKDEAFGLSYHALEFLFFALTNPGGNGLETAKALDAIKETYGEILETTGKILEKARADLKEIQFLQDKVTAMQQGFYLEREDGTEEAAQAAAEEAEGFATPTAEELLNKEKK